MNEALSKTELKYNQSRAKKQIVAIIHFFLKKTNSNSTNTSNSPSQTQMQLHRARTKKLMNNRRGKTMENDTYNMLFPRRQGGQKVITIHKSLLYEFLVPTSIHTYIFFVLDIFFLSMVDSSFRNECRVDVKKNRYTHARKLLPFSIQPYFLLTSSTTLQYSTCLTSPRNKKGGETPDVVLEQ